MAELREGPTRCSVTVRARVPEQVEVRVVILMTSCAIERRFCQCQPRIVPSETMRFAHPVLDSFTV